MASSNVRLIALLALLALPAVPMRAEPFSKNIARGETYLLHHFNQNLGLIYESEDTGLHWLRNEFPNFHWKYDQTYWLYSDNLFAHLALRPDHPEIANRIRESIEAYNQSPANLFEVVAGQHIQLPLQNPQDFIVAKDENHVIMIRRHNASSIALGDYVDFWMYEALEHALEGDLTSAEFLVHQAERLWRGDGLWDWSFTVYDHIFSNQKLALLLFTARAIGINLEHESEMETHLWGMQNDDGGVASLSLPTGEKAGSANAETTALSILIYDQTLLSRFPKAQSSSEMNASTLAVPVAIVALLVVFALPAKRIARSKLSWGRM
jgi:hypothetical protein